MKKKIVKILVALIACAACVIGLVACGNSAEPVAGKKYVFEKALVKSEGAIGYVPDSALNESCKGSYIAFGNGNYCEMGIDSQSYIGIYKQKGKSVQIDLDNIPFEFDFKVKGDTVSWYLTDNYNKVTKLTYRFVSENTGEIGSTGMKVAGKKFVFSDVKLEIADSVNKETAEEMKRQLILIQYDYVGSYFAFDNNGGYKQYYSYSGSTQTGTYIQNNTSLELTDSSNNLIKITVVEDTIRYEKTGLSDSIYTYIYKLRNY